MMKARKLFLHELYDLTHVLGDAVLDSSIQGKIEEIQGDYTDVMEAMHQLRKEGFNSAGAHDFYTIRSCMIDIEELFEDAASSVMKAMKDMDCHEL